MLCKEPGTSFTTTQIVEAKEIDRNSLRGALSALTRHIDSTSAGGTGRSASSGDAIGEGYPAEAQYVITEQEAER